jgi:hypothetical protein
MGSIRVESPKNRTTFSRNTNISAVQTGICWIDQIRQEFNIITNSNIFT